jgi:hypothetical protein
MKAAKLEIAVLRQEAEGKRQKEGRRRSIFTNMRCSLAIADWGGFTFRTHLGQFILPLCNARKYTGRAGRPSHKKNQNHPAIMQRLNYCSRS